jgi:hypothetical protein
MAKRGNAKVADAQLKRGGEAVAQPKNRMNKTETEFSLILEAQKRRGEIIGWRFEGISLAWGADPSTGKQMWYTADFWVLSHTPFPLLFEVKGPHIFEKDLIRFKGCRAEWGTHFQFELHQKTKSGWTRVC